VVFLKRIYAGFLLFVHICIAVGDPSSRGEGWFNPAIFFSFLKPGLTFLHYRCHMVFWTFQKSTPGFGPGFNIPYSIYYYTPAPRRERGGILFYLCPSFRPSKIFFVTFFSVNVDGRNLIFGHKRHNKYYMVYWTQGQNLELIFEKFKIPYDICNAKM
jgi:hypothetical protein